MNQRRSLIDTRRFFASAAVCALVASLTACGGTDGADAESAAPALPVSEPRGDPSAEAAARGRDVFVSRGCIACHRIGQGRLVGPDLQNVTRRVDFPWFYHMVTNPDSMTKNDSTAKRLLGEYLTPMSDQNVQDDEIPLLWEYLRYRTEVGPLEGEEPTGSSSGAMPGMHGGMRGMMRGPGARADTT